MPFLGFFTKVVPAVKAQEDEEDLVDPVDGIRQSCAPHCISFKTKLDQCNERVNSRTKTEENCGEELMDWVHCVDHCVAKTLFSKLK